MYKLQTTNYKLQTKKGFTFIEALVAISILLVSISAPLTIASRSLSSAYFARDQIIAFYLAQDAVEYVRNKRDGNFLTNSSWLLGFPDVNNLSFTVDTINDGMALCPVGGCDPLDHNSSTGFYSYNDPGGSTSRFTRTVSINSITADEIVITVTISWETGLLDRSFSIKENIFNWQ